MLAFKFRWKHGLSFGNSDPTPGMTLKSRFLQSGKKSGNAFWRLLPVLLAVLLLASLTVQLVPQLIDMGILGHGTLSDMLWADFIAGLSSAQPVVSYIMAGELRNAGIDLYTVTTFIVSWVTVGIIPLPAEAVMLGWRFALWRNIVAFFLALAIAWLTVVTTHA